MPAGSEITVIAFCAQERRDDYIHFIQHHLKHHHVNAICVFELRITSTTMRACAALARASRRQQSAYGGWSPTWGRNGLSASAFLPADMVRSGMDLRSARTGYSL